MERRHPAGISHAPARCQRSTRRDIILLLSLMQFSSRFFVSITLVSFAAIMFSACGSGVETAKNAQPTAELSPATPIPTPTPTPTPAVPNLQTELFSGPDKASSSPIGQFDFKNYTYPLPHGWQNPDGTTEDRKSTRLNSSH